MYVNDLTISSSNRSLNTSKITVYGGLTLVNHVTYPLQSLIGM